MVMIEVALRKQLRATARGAVVAQGLGAHAVWALVLSGSAAHMGGFEARSLNDLRQISTVSPFSNLNIVILLNLKSTIPSGICYAY
jgi:hypothetical protein